MADERASILGCMAVGAGMGIVWFVPAAFTVWTSWVDHRLNFGPEPSLMILSFIFALAFPAITNARYRGVKAGVSILIGAVIVVLPLIVVTVVAWYMTYANFSNHR